MTPRERVLSAVEHREPDGLPVGFKATDVVLEALKRHFEVADDPRRHSISTRKSMGQQRVNLQPAMKDYARLGQRSTYVFVMVGVGFLSCD